MEQSTRFQFPVLKSLGMKNTKGKTVRSFEKPIIQERWIFLNINTYIGSSECSMLQNSYSELYIKR
jgi:hypothetical protein